MSKAAVSNISFPPTGFPSRFAPSDRVDVLAAANVAIIGKMASQSCYLEIGGFSKWCLKLV